MNATFNENELRLDCNGNVIEKPFLYDINETMKLLGRQVVIYGDSEEFKLMQDVLTAYEISGDSMEKLIVQLIKKFACYSLLSNFFTLGVIFGMRKERKRRKKQ